MLKYQNGYVALRIVHLRLLLVRLPKAHSQCALRVSVRLLTRFLTPLDELPTVDPASAGLSPRLADSGRFGLGSACLRLLLGRLLLKALLPDELLHFLLELFLLHLKLLDPRVFGALELLHLDFFELEARGLVFQRGLLFFETFLVALQFFLVVFMGLVFLRERSDFLR